MSATYVFLSHCVRAEDNEAVIQKRNLIDYLEGRGFGVFDYRERPGESRDWLNEIREQFLNCGCVIYFARKWPEDDPGVVMIEVGAALLVGRPFFIYSPNGRRGEPFADYSKGLCHAVAASREIVCTTVAELEPMLTGIARKASGKETPFMVLTQAFLRNHWGANLSRFRATQAVMRALVATGPGLLKLRPLTTEHAVVGCWRVPHADALIFVKGDAMATVETARFEQDHWTRIVTINPTLSVVELLRRVYSVGVLRGQTYLLLKNDNGWSLISHDGETSLSPPAELSTALRRTYLTTEPGSELPFFYADGIGYRIRAAAGRIELAEDSEARVPEDFVASLSPSLPARLAHIHGLDGAQALTSGGRVEGFPHSKNAPGFWLHGTTLELGMWCTVSCGEILRQLLIQGDGFRKLPEKKLNLMEDDAAHIGAKVIKSVIMDDFDWLLGLLHRINPEFRDLLGSYYYTHDELSPLFLLPSFTMGVLTPEIPPERGLGYYRLDLRWDMGLRSRLWSILGHGPVPI